MSCNSNNGLTYVNTCIPLSGGTADTTTYVIEMTHYLCGNRKVCVNGAFPLVSNLTYTPQRVYSVGNKAYNCDILISGTVTYMPYVCGGNQCDVCPRTDNVWTSVSVPLSASDMPTVTAGTTVTSPANVKDCCSVTNAVSITTSFNVVQVIAASGD